MPEPIITPPASTPVADQLGNFGRPWFLYFTALTKRLGVLADAVMGWSALTHQDRVAKVTAEGTIGEAEFADSDVVLGAPSLTTQGAIPKVSATDGTLNESALTDDGQKITNRRTIAGAAQPQYVIDSGGTTGKGRIGRVIDLARVDLTVNLSFDGTNWNLDNTASDGALVVVNPSQVEFWFAPAGANPVTPVLNTVVTTAGEVDTPTAYRVGGVQVVGAQQPAVTAPSGGGTVIVAPTGGAVIDIQARAAIAGIISAISSLGNTVDPAARTAINDIIATLQAHGLTA